MENHIKIMLASRNIAARYTKRCVSAAVPTVPKCLAHTISPASRVPLNNAHRGVPKSKSEQDGKKNERPTPAPSFNKEADPVSKTFRRALDDSMIGLTGGQIFHEMMLRQNVDTVFGYSGGAILPVFDGIFNSDKFQFIMPRHEQGAGHMAEGYARVTGKPGIVVVTSGPGATNVVTPMQDALSDGTPMVVFTGQVATNAIGTDAFQEADVVGITRSCTKWAVMVKSIEEMPRRINEAFEIATSGRPGPVLVDLPKDVTAGVLRRAIPTETTIPSRLLADLTSTAAGQSVVKDSIIEAVELLKKAKRPLLLVGNGIMAAGANAAKCVTDIAKKANIPVASTLHGLGAFDETDPLSLRMVGMHGANYANRALQNADLIIALGARFDERVTGKVTAFAPKTREAALENRGGIVHFEILPKNISKVIDATVAVEGDLAETLPTFAPLVPAVTEAERAQWLSEIQEWKDKYPFAYEKDDPNEPIRPQTVVTTLSDVVTPYKENVVISTGVGQHQMWAAQFFKFKHPRSIVTSGGLGTMGYGLPAAIGAKVGRPDAIVIDIDGDASFNMTLSELSTAAMYGIPVKVIVFNNEEQGMVTQWQSLFYEDRFSHTHQVNPNFMKLAEAMGVTGIRIEKLNELKPGLEKMISTKGPVLVEVVVDQKVPVLPLVPGGKSLDEGIVYDQNVENERRRLRAERLARINLTERREYDG